MGLKISSSAFKDGEMIPSKYTCDGENISPPLSWGTVPEDTKSIALIADDPDAPHGTWVHWVLFDLPAKTVALTEGIPQKTTLPDGSRQGVNDSHTIGYDGPAPPSGVHRYYFKIYALDSMLALESGITKVKLLKAMEGHILAEGTLMGRYRRGL
jgi:Raf kinase inhibitor-like YbhB/YbcL family protein